MIPGFFAAQAASHGAGLWTPANLSVAPKLWVDWGSSITESGGGVLSWDNSKGSIGGAFEQTSSSWRPTLLPSAVGGKNAVRFNGVTSYMWMQSVAAGGMFRATTAAWIMTIYRKINSDAGANRIQFFSSVETSGLVRFATYVGRPSPNENRRALASRVSDSGSPTVTPSGASNVGQWDISIHLNDWSVGQLSSYANGSQELNTSVPSGTTTNAQSRNNRVYLGSDDAGVSAGDFDLAAILVGSGSLPSTSEREKLEGWAAWQCGLQDNLPVGHPYKSAPPTA